MKKLLIVTLLLTLVLTGCTTNIEQNRMNASKRAETVTYGKKYSASYNGMSHEAQIHLTDTSFSMSGVNSPYEVVGTAINMGNRVVLNTENGSGQRFVFEKNMDSLRFLPDESSNNARNVLPESIVFNPEY